MTGGAETQRASFGKIVCISGAGGTSDNGLLVFLAKDFVAVCNAGIFAKRAGRERIAICRMDFFHVSALLFLHCNTMLCIRQVEKRKNSIVSAAPTIPPTPLQMMAGRTRTFSADAKEAVCSWTESPEKMTAKAVRGKPPLEAASV